MQQDDTGIIWANVISAYRDATHLGLCRVTLDGDIVHCNKALAAILGRDVDALQGRNWVEEYVLSVDRPGFRAGLQRLREVDRGTYSSQLRMLEPSGNSLPVHVEAVVICDRLGTPEYVIAAAWEVGCDDEETLDAIHKLEAMLAVMKAQKQVVHVGDSWGSGDKVGRDKTQNSTKAIRWLVAGFAVMVGCMAWLMYYVATQGSQAAPVPPQIESPF